MNLKTGIVILVLLALCFFSGVGTGLLAMNNPPPADPVPTPSWGKSLDRLFPPGKATVDEVLSSRIESGGGSCFIDRDNQELEVPLGNICSFFLSTAFRPRTISLDLVAGSDFPEYIKLYQPVREDGTIDVADQRPSENNPLVFPADFRLSSRQSKNDTIRLEISCGGGFADCVLKIR